jgi:transcriptional regulator with XRE-family HTH domain
MTEELEKELYLEIGRRLTEERKKRNMSVYALAKKTGEQSITINRIESGHRFNFHHAFWLVDLFGIDVTKILTELKLKGEYDAGPDINDFI